MNQSLIGGYPMLIKAESSVPETQAMFQEIIDSPGKIFDLMRLDFKSIAEKALSDLLKEELTHFLGRQKYQRGVTVKPNHRNGYYERQYTAKDIGELKIKVPRDRQGEFNSKVIQKYDRYEKAIETDICLMFLSGLSTRGIELVSKSLLGRKISRGEVSNVNKELLTGIDAWRSRNLADLQIKYMYIDGVNFHMRVDHAIEIIPMLVVIGVTQSGQRTFLTIQQGDKESASTWRQVFKDLKQRGLDGAKVQLGIMDGLSGLMTVFREEFSHAKVQRCQVHVSRNVLCKVPQKQKNEVADKLRDIFYAGSKKKAMENFNAFIDSYEASLPSAVKCLSNVIDECLTFFSFPSEEWPSLRTTNLIERVNKEFKRRTKPMEILAGEASAYRLLCFVALKMELGWRGCPIGKNIRPLLEAKKFTQLN
jgi:putative transposase